MKLLHEWMFGCDQTGGGFSVHTGDWEQFTAENHWVQSFSIPSLIYWVITQKVINYISIWNKKKKKIIDVPNNTNTNK